MIENILTDLETSAVLTIEENEEFKIITTKFREALHTLESHGPTVLSYGNFNKAVYTDRKNAKLASYDSVQQLLAYFRAAGHFLYV